MHHIIFLTKRNLGITGENLNNKKYQVKYILIIKLS